jgi:hypothetical protein
MSESFASGETVEHPEFGVGTVVEILGDIVDVDFYGERIPVEASRLTSQNQTLSAPAAPGEVVGYRDPDLRRAFEAINLGVVPPTSKELIKFTIGGTQRAEQIGQWLEGFRSHGLCRVVFGRYGSGKTHFLRLVRATALERGWVVAYLEFDPKAADPARPFLVYRGLMQNLTFPERSDGSQVRGFSDLIMEIRKHWDAVSTGELFRRSPWFLQMLETLRHYGPGDQDYEDASQWLVGAPIHQSTINTLTNAVRRGTRVPRMPRQGEVSDVYVFHLVVLAEIVRALNYKGLVLILDEAEHVRGYSVRRRDRANNFFDLTARAAHPPLTGAEEPRSNDQGFEVFPFWRTGPHFALFVGLTEGDTFSEHIPLRDACVFLHEEMDRLFLDTPKADDYHRWCRMFLERFQSCYPDVTGLLASADARERIARVLREEFTHAPDESRTLRVWVKLAALIPCVLLSGNATSLEELEAIVRRSARSASGTTMPWDD